MTSTEALRPPESYWIDTATGPDRTARALPAEVDVAVVGAGITGLTAAYLLAKSGRSVAVLDAGRVAAGVSGHTTAKVSAQHGLIYHSLRKVSKHTAARYGAAQLAAIEWIAEESSARGIDCDFERRDSIVYSTKPSSQGTLEKEAEAAAAAGMPASFVSHTDLPVATVGAVDGTWLWPPTIRCSTRADSSLGWNRRVSSLSPAWAITSPRRRPCRWTRTPITRSAQRQTRIPTAPA